jgi:hypothetical protein
MATETKTPTRQHQTVELARYVTDLREQRIVAARRGPDDIVRVYDLPVDGRGRSYTVEQGFESWRELAMLVRDYAGQAARLGDCPMSRRALRRLVEIHHRPEVLS